MSCEHCVHYKERWGKVKDFSLWVNRGVECESCHYMKQRINNHQEEIADLKNQLEVLRIESCMVKRSADSENLNDPCRKSELKRKYRHLNTQIWGRTKQGINKFDKPKQIKLFAKNLIKETFEEGAKDMRRKVEGMLQQNNGISSTVQEKMSPYIQSAMRNLQMLVFLHFQDIQKTSDFKTFVEKNLHHPKDHERKNPCYPEDHERKNPGSPEDHELKNPGYPEDHEQKYPGYPEDHEGKYPPHAKDCEQKNPNNLEVHQQKTSHVYENENALKEDNELTTPRPSEVIHEEINPRHSRVVRDQKNPLVYISRFLNKKNTSKQGVYEQKIPSLPEVLHELYVHCYFLSRLMALHDPPIELCWDRHYTDAFPDLKGTCPTYV